MENPGLHFDIEALAETTRQQLFICTSSMEKIVLSISLMHLGKESVPIKYELESELFKKDLKRFSFFMAPILSGSSNKLLSLLKRFSLFHILFRCIAFYYTLILEYEILLKVRPLPSEEGMNSYER